MSNAADNDVFITLVSAVGKDRDMAARILAITRLPEFHRLAKDGSLLA